MKKTTRASRFDRKKAETRVLLYLMLHPRLAPSVDRDTITTFFGEILYDEIIRLSLEGVNKITPIMLEENIEHKPEYTSSFIQLAETYEAYLRFSPMKQHDLYVIHKDKLENIKESEDLMLSLERSISKLGNGENPDDVLFGIKNIRSKTAGKQLPFTKYALETIFTDTMNNIKTNIPKLDELGGLSRGNMISIAADSGMQKTMFSLWFMINTLLINPSLKGVYFEKEMPAHDIYIRIVSYMTKKPIKDILSMYLSGDPITKSTIMKAFEDSSQREEYKSLMERFKIVPSTYFHSAQDMWKIVERERADIWVLDYATMLMGDGADKNYDLYIKSELIVLKNMLAETNSIGIVLSQLKQTNNVEYRPCKVPLVNDMEWGKTLKQFSTFVFGLFSPYSYYPDWERIEPDWFYLVTNKSRNGSLSPIPFLAQPNVCTYGVPEENEADNMLLWLQKYRRGSSDKRK